MSTPARVDELDRRVPGENLHEKLKEVRIEWPTRDLDLEEQVAFLERVQNALTNLSGSSDVPSQLSAADADVLRPVVEKMRAVAPDADFSFFAPYEPDAAGSRSA
ncbi:hypothetical protein [Amycolatopsis sp. NPDC004378]